MLIRYPGGKNKLARRIVKAIARFMDDKKLSYVEPFFGAGAIGLTLLEKSVIHQAVFNDYDPGIFAIWHTVKHNPSDLLSKIMSFKPSIDHFYAFKKELKELARESVWTDSLSDIAFKKIAVHQMSYSGLGTMSGGPLGGDDQTSAYKVDCRWSPNHLKKEINRLSKLMGGTTSGLPNVYLISNDDFEKTIRVSYPGSFIYLDPPYFEKGPQLYQYSFKEEDHKRLADTLAEIKNPWLLSYDDCPEIRDFFKFAVVKEVPLNYTINGSVDKQELLIAPVGYECLLEDFTVRAVEDISFED